VKWYAYNVIMLVAYAGLLANCGAYLAFGWRFPAPSASRSERD
jgi:hypothetical protein